MDTCIGATREDEQLVFFRSSQPLKRPEDTDEFTLDGANIRLDLTAVKGITKVADAKEQPDLIGQNTLSSFI